MKIANIILAVLFAIFAIVQYNDPDSWAWIILYAFVTFLFVNAFRGKYLDWGIWAGIGAVIWGALESVGGAMEFLTNDDGIAFSQGMSNTFPYIEVAREFGGLVITLIALVYLGSQAGIFGKE